MCEERCLRVKTDPQEYAKTLWRVMVKENLSPKQAAKALDMPVEDIFKFLQARTK